MASEFGYAGKILKVDLSSRSMTDVPTADYASEFIGSWVWLLKSGRTKPH